MNTVLPVPQDRAAQMVATKAFTDDEIVKDLGVDLETLAEWMEQPAFQARVAESTSEFAAMFQFYPIVVCARRLSEVRRQWDELRRMMSDLANDPEMATVLGRKRVREAGGLAAGSPGS